MKRKSSEKAYFSLKPPLLSLLAGLAGFALIYLILINVVSPKRFSLVVGEIAQSTITATKAIEDEYTTRQNIEAARAAVDRIFKQDENTANIVQADVEDALEIVAEYRKKYQRDVSEYKTPDMTVYMPSVSLSESFIEAIKPVVLTRSQAQNILLVSDSSYNSFINLYVQLVRSALASGIKEGELADVSSRLTRDLQGPYFTVDTSLVPLAGALSKAYLKPNLYFDEVATKAERDLAEDAVEPVMYKKGQNVVVANEIVTQAQYEVISKLGLLEDDSVDVNLYSGLAIIVSLVFLQFVIYMSLLEKEIIASPKLIVMIITVILAIMGIGVLSRSLSTYLIPLQLGVFLFAMLLNQRFAIVCNMSLAVLVSILATGDEGLFAAGMLNILIMGVISGALCAVLVRRSTQRLSTIYSGLVVAVMNFAIIFGIGIMTTTGIREPLVSAAFSAGSAVLSALLAMGLAPLLENLFGVVTPQMLMEISNPNNPLLRRLQTEAPGTYHHSLIVANLAEAAARSIGADNLLARVGAYFHDCGKLRRPLMFKENQIGEENPHENMDPYVSAAIITDHTRDGVLMAQKYKLPKSIENIIRQHHGRSTASFFYYTAQKNAEEAGLGADSVDKDDFSYDGPRPNTKESAIVFLADSVEAATRSLKTHNKEEIEKMIRKLIKNRLQDGQLDDAPLTLKELETIAQTFLFVLSGFYHDRIEYPELDRALKGHDAKAIPAPPEKRELTGGGA